MNRPLPSRDPLAPGVVRRMPRSAVVLLALEARGASRREPPKQGVLVFLGVWSGL